jgi:hypothetical protein
MVRTVLALVIRAMLRAGNDANNVLIESHNVTRTCLVSLPKLGGTIHRNLPFGNKVFGQATGVDPPHNLEHIAQFNVFARDGEFFYGVGCCHLRKIRKGARRIFGVWQ